MKFQLILFSIVTFWDAANGQCYKLYVSGASSRYNYVNGYYYSYSSCTGYTVWKREFDLTPVTTYVSYDWPTFNWVIRQTGSCTGTILARHPDSSGYSDPTYLPGYWEEWNPYTLNFELSTSLSVVCYDNYYDSYYDGWNGWEIFGIVIGCLCGMIILVILIAAICHCNKKRKLRNSPHPQTRPPAAYSNPALDAITVTTMSGQCVDVGPYYPPTTGTSPPYPTSAVIPPYPTTDPVYSTIPVGCPNPPIYDNSPPPSYAEVHNNTKGVQNTYVRS